MARLQKLKLYFKDIHSKTCFSVGLFESIPRFWNIVYQNLGETFGRPVIFAYKIRGDNNFHKSYGK